jgi:hypothetical protein
VFANSGGRSEYIGNGRHGQQVEVETSHLCADQTLRLNQLFITCGEGTGHTNTLLFGTKQSGGTTI